jgi:hypothetical protein
MSRSVIGAKANWPDNRWYRRGLAEKPKAVSINRFLTPSYLLAGRKEEAKRSLADLVDAFPNLTIAQSKNVSTVQSQLFRSRRRGSRMCGDAHFLSEWTEWKSDDLRWTPSVGQESG